MHDLQPEKLKYSQLFSPRNKHIIKSQGISWWLQALQGILLLFYSFAQIVGFAFPLKHEALATAGCRIPGLIKQCSELAKAVFLCFSQQHSLFSSKFWGKGEILIGSIVCNGMSESRCIENGITCKANMTDYLGIIPMLGISFRIRGSAACK